MGFKGNAQKKQKVPTSKLWRTHTILFFFGGGSGRTTKVRVPPPP